ncbi:MAG TPA: universal stress protein [Gaiellaceae bacterium]|nr:universal stress protein [Gaiellaceae bacterium]
MTTSRTGRSDVFDRVLCAVDGSPGALVAVRQARQLTSPLGRAELVTVVEVPMTVVAPYSAQLIVHEARRRASAALAAARAAWPEVPGEVLEGPPKAGRVLAELERRHATLAAVGAGSHDRAAGAVLGSVPTTLLHRSACSVLVARAGLGATDGFPQAVVVGVDGSRASLAALTAARDLGRRLDATVRVLAAGSGVDEEALAGEPDVERVSPQPLEALLRAARDADLVVVGSRGLRGLRALGSVSERLGHRAPCSVLVVKPPAR